MKIILEKNFLKLNKNVARRIYILKLRLITLAVTRAGVSVF